MKHFYLIMYDISDNKRRIKVEKLLSSYGYRVNYSVFECIISAKVLEKIVQELKKTTLIFFTFPNKK